MPYRTEAFARGRHDETGATEERDVRDKMTIDRLADCSTAASFTGFLDRPEIGSAIQPHSGPPARGRRCVKPPAHRLYECRPHGGREGDVSYPQVTTRAEYVTIPPNEG